MRARALKKSPAAFAPPDRWSNLSQVHHNVRQVVASGTGQEGRTLFACSQRLDMGEAELGAFLRALVRAIKLSLAAAKARSAKRLPAGRQQAADRRAGFEIARDHAWLFSLRRAAQTIRNARTIGAFLRCDSLGTP